MQKKLGNFYRASPRAHRAPESFLFVFMTIHFLHVDIKFVTLWRVPFANWNTITTNWQEWTTRDALNNSQAKFPYPDYQWIEDRFLDLDALHTVKIGRGEYFEAFDSFRYIENDRPWPPVYQEWLPAQGCSKSRNSIRVKRFEQTKTDNSLLTEAISIRQLEKFSITI